jgi:hypothetical protein
VSGGNGAGGELRAALREALEELLPGLAAGAAGHRDDDARPVPRVPPPPVAAVHRPAGYAWSEPAARPGGGIAAPTPPLESVALSCDADLDAFVRRLAQLFESAAERDAVRTGRRRFTLAAGAAEAAAAPAGAALMRVERGAVTERIVARAAEQQARLVLGPRAVLTPLGRDRARRLGVEVERERPC